MKVALCQFIGDVDKEANIQNVLRYARQAGDNGANLICFHELCTTTYFCYEENYDHCALAEPIPGPATGRVAEVAREYGMVVVLPLYEKAMRGELYNAAAVINPDGSIQGVYRKTNIPMAKRPENPSGNEKLYFKPGNLGYPVFDTPWGIRFGMVICNDRHFPEGPRILGLRGADLLLVPTASFGRHYRPLWEIELRAYAYQNAYYVGGVNKVGVDRGVNNRNHYYGSAMFVSPRGEILAGAGDEDDEIIYGEVDPALIEELRNMYGFYRDRRPDLYAELTR
ncbi:MAG: acyltransferase [Candidatus Tectomicrobia bacterium]|nr:acyltransferase [Candidatus Tectomicrobia bacterium]